LTFGQDYAYYEVERVSKMKKLVLIPIIALLLSGAGLVATVATYPVSVNGERLDVTVLNQNGTTYLPLKAVGQALGADIVWTGESVEITTTEVEIVTTDGSTPVDVDTLKKACVMIYADNGAMLAQGSGVYVDYDRVLSAQHVFGWGCTNIRDAADPKNTMTILGYAPASDAALLEPSVERKPVKIGDSDEIQIGDKVIVISSPAGKGNTVTYAEVIKMEPIGVIIKCELAGGSSGGAVFDMNGCLVGILNTGNKDDTEYVFKPINAIRRAL
jgi:S1-C subfamily serine protease